MASRTVKHPRTAAPTGVVAAYERAIAILHEQLADTRKERDRALAREAEAMERLVTIATAHTFAPTVPRAPEQSPVRNVRRGAEESDPFREVPFGDPMAMFKSPEDAALVDSDGLLRALGTDADNQQ